MKKALLTVIIVLIVLCFAGCQKAEKEVSSIKEIETSDNTLNEPVLDASAEVKVTVQSQVQAKQERYEQDLRNLQSVSVSEIAISYLNDQMQEKKLAITDKQLIKRWLDLIAEMDVEARPVEYSSGRGFTLTFKSNDKIISSDGYMLPYIYGDYDDPTMLYVCNYDKLASKIEQLKKDTGIIQP